MPALFDKLGLRFQYPENWQVDESDALQGDRAVTLVHPDGGAFWSVAVHPRESDPAELAQEAQQAMRQTYSDLDSEDVDEEVAGCRLVGYDLNFYCLDLTNTALIRAVRTPLGTLVILCQAEDREFAAVEKVFRALTVSLLRCLPGEG
jgi:hypothetical protein